MREDAQRENLALRNNRPNNRQNDRQDPRNAQCAPDTQSVVVLLQHDLQRKRHLAFTSGQPWLFMMPTAQLPAAQTVQLVALSVPQHGTAVVVHANDQPATLR